jgi:hypothetical protein
MPSTNDVWARNAAASAGEQITLPSGQTAIVRKLDIEELLATGFLNQIDAFTSLVDVDVIQPAKTKLQGRQPKKKTLAERKAEQERGEAETNDALMRKLATNPSLINDMAVMLNRLAPLIVVEPVVKCHLDDDGNVIGSDFRDPDVIYTDMIGFLDKMEMFTYAIGEVGDLAPFREDATGHVAGVADGGDVPLPPVANPGTR